MDMSLTSMGSEGNFHWRITAIDSLLDSWFLAQLMHGTRELWNFGARRPWCSGLWCIVFVWVLSVAGSPMGRFAPSWLVVSICWHCGTRRFDLSARSCEVNRFDYFQWTGRFDGRLTLSSLVHLTHSYSSPAQVEKQKTTVFVVGVSSNVRVPGMSPSCVMKVYITILKVSYSL